MLRVGYRIGGGLFYWVEYTCMRKGLFFSLIELVLFVIKGFTR